MPDDIASHERRGRPGFGLDFRAFRRPMAPAWKLTVIETSQVTPRTMSVSLAGEGIADMEWRPGQDLVLSLPQSDGDVARRHYTIRDLNREARRLDIDFVLHGDSPATRWIRSARPGDTLEAHGPRGRTRLAEDAERHIFVGDETCLPGIFAMAETLPRGARAHALIEVEGPAETQTLASDGEVRIEWVFRHGGAPGPSNLLLDRLRELGPSPARTHAYVIGETSNVRAQRHFLLESGFDRSQITAEGYWRPGRIGGHDHV